MRGRYGAVEGASPISAMDRDLWNVDCGEMPKLDNKNYGLCIMLRLNLFYKISHETPFYRNRFCEKAVE